MTEPRAEIILNVDDTEALRYIKGRDLRAGGFTVLDATTGAEALRLTEQHRPPIVLLDVQLPDIDGFEVCRYIKEKWPEVMVLMTSATFVTSSHRTLGLDAGADSYLVQPAEPLELVAAVNALLRIRRSEDQLRGLNEILGGQVKDRTAELTRAIVALKSSADRMRALFQTTYVFHGYMAADGIMLDANRASLEAFNGSLDDIVGKAFWETPWFAGTPGMTETIKRLTDRAAAGEQVEEAIVLNLAGVERTFDMALRPIQSGGGKVTGIVAEAVDTTQRLKAEQALRQSQKMEAIGQLTGGLAHDFNNLLTAVVGNLDFIRARSKEESIRRWANNAFRAAERGSKLTSQLLAFSRTQKLNTAAVDVNALIGDMREMLNQTLGANIEIRTDLAASLGPATADVNQLELALLNLAINARDAMSGGGSLTIKTSAAPDGSVLIAVSDTGAGMPSDVAERAFDPFFTTKPTGKGTGLGLSQVYGFVRQSGGEVTIESEVGKGTTVGIRLLRAVQSSTGRKSEQDDDAAARTTAHEKLLLVDDDPDVREIVAAVLAELGYEVRQAETGQIALTMLDEFNPDLMIVDFAMPGINGAEVVVAARRRHTALKILFLSGYADSKALEAAIGSTPLLRKPFRPIELATAVRSALDATFEGCP